MTASDVVLLTFGCMLLVAFIFMTTRIRRFLDELVERDNELWHKLREARARDKLKEWKALQERQGSVERAEDNDGAGG